MCSYAFKSPKEKHYPILVTPITRHWHPSFLICWIVTSRFGLPSKHEAMREQKLHFDPSLKSRSDTILDAAASELEKKKESQSIPSWLNAWFDLSNNYIKIKIKNALEGITHAKFFLVFSARKLKGHAKRSATLKFRDHFAQKSNRQTLVNFSKCTKTNRTLPFTCFKNL